MADSPNGADPQRATQVAAVLQAISDFDLTSSEAWTQVASLSPNTLIDDVEVDPEGVIIEGDRFKGVMSVYVVLQYGGAKKSAFQTSEAFRGQFHGHFNGASAVIDTVTVDVSPFFAGEA